YRTSGGTGPALGALKVCWGHDEADARKLAYELWPTSGIPGQLSQDLPTPAHFEQAASIVTEEAATEGVPYGPDPERYVEAVRSYAEAGFDEVAITQIGPDQDGFLEFYERELRGRLGARGPAGPPRAPQGPGPACCRLRLPQAVPARPERGVSAIGCLNDDEKRTLNQIRGNGYCPTSAFVEEGSVAIVSPPLPPPR